MVSARWLALVVCVGGVVARAEGIAGMGRVSVVGGWRRTPNGYFESRALEQGHPLVARTPGFQGAASFGYGFMPWAELVIDLIGGFETFTLQGHLPFSSSVYGGLFGLRASRLDLPVRGLVPHLQVQGGPQVVMVSSASLRSPEHLVFALSANAGLTWQFAERFGVTLDVRWLFARANVATISGANVGGLFVSLGVTMYFPGTLERKELSVPGF